MKRPEPTSERPKPWIDRRIDPPDGYKWAEEGRELGEGWMWASYEPHGRYPRQINWRTPNLYARDTPERRGSRDSWGLLYVVVDSEPDPEIYLQQLDETTDDWGMAA